MNVMKIYMLGGGRLATEIIFSFGMRSVFVNCFVKSSRACAVRDTVTAPAVQIAGSLCVLLIICKRHLFMYYAFIAKLIRIQTNKAKVKWNDLHTIFNFNGALQNFRRNIDRFIQYGIRGLGQAPVT